MVEMSLAELSGRGWTMVNPPLRSDDDSVVARYRGTPVRAGFLTERVEDSDDAVHFKYRSGCYDLEVKVDFEIGRGQVRVTEVE